nr:MAG TPA: hypothetical protein [Herelleviridae sp.]
MYKGRCVGGLITQPSHLSVRTQYEPGLEVKKQKFLTQPVSRL